MYLEFFNLRESPFRLSADPGYLFLSKSHARARAGLEYALYKREGVMVLTGPIGTGKTMLVQEVCRASAKQVLMLHQTQLNDTQLLQAILLSLEHHRATDNKAELLTLLRRVLNIRLASGQRPVLVIDDAQNLSMTALEEVRMLADMQSQGMQLLGLVLVGQPNLRETIARPELEQLQQRVILQSHLFNLSAEETGAYIAHRMGQAAGRGRELFRDEAVRTIYEYTAGVPRRINILADMALTASCLEQVPVVTRSSVLSAVEELMWERRVLSGEAGARTPEVVPLSPSQAESMGSPSPLPAPALALPWAWAPQLLTRMGLPVLRGMARQIGTSLQRRAGVAASKTQRALAGASLALNDSRHWGGQLVARTGAGPVVAAVVGIELIVGGVLLSNASTADGAADANVTVDASSVAATLTSAVVEPSAAVNRLASKARERRAALDLDLQSVGDDALVLMAARYQAPAPDAGKLQNSGAHEVAAALPSTAMAAPVAQAPRGAEVFTPQALSEDDPMTLATPPAAAVLSEPVVDNARSTSATDAVFMSAAAASPMPAIELAAVQSQNSAAPAALTLGAAVAPAPASIAGHASELKAAPASAQASPADIVQAFAQQHGLQSERWLLGQSKDEFLIQMLTTRSAEELQRFVEALNFDGELAYYRQSAEDGKSERFVLVTGFYPSYARAEAAMRRLPGVVQRNGPWVRRVRLAHEAIRESLAEG